MISKEMNSLTENLHLTWKFFYSQSYELDVILIYDSRVPSSTAT